MKRAIKICGLNTPEAVAAALAGGATHVGFIFFAKSPRHVEPAQAAILRQGVEGRAQVVAVTVDAEDDLLDQIVTSVRPDILQLHGKETPERVRFLKDKYRIPVMRAFSVSSTADLEQINPFRGIADFFLFDAKPPKNSELPGGNGVSFDWKLLSALDADIDYMLSGGLNAGNIAEALRITRAPGIDISSGVERAPGQKDVRLIRDFFQAVAKAEVTTSAKTV